MGLLFQERLGAFLRRNALFLYLKLIKPRSANEDDRRREFILNVLLVASILLCLVLLVIVIRNCIVQGSAREGVSPWVLLGIMGVFVSLLVVSRYRMYRISSLIFLVLYFLPITYTLFSWGADLPEAVLAYAVIIVMAGVLLGSRFAFWMTCMIAACMLGISYGQIHGYFHIESEWRHASFDLYDAAALVTTLFVINLISWLSNRETEKSLQRARLSEAALMQERDQLEVRVEERTRELRHAQIDKMAQLYRFVEFGRLASGFFHDLAAPLSAISLNLEQLKMDDGSPEVTEARRHVDLAFKTSRKLEGFLEATRRQLRHQTVSQDFVVKAEIEYVLQILQHKALKLHVELTFQATGDTIHVKGNPYKFHQVMMNLISNALDAFQGLPDAHQPRRVTINQEVETNRLRFTIQDTGSGIDPAILPRIFEPFFSTKSDLTDMGIGLSTVKDAVENEFHGTIDLESTLGVGTKVTITLPWE